MLSVRICSDNAQIIKKAINGKELHTCTVVLPLHMLRIILGAKDKKKNDIFTKFMAKKTMTLKNLWHWKSYVKRRRTKKNDDLLSRRGYIVIGFALVNT